MNKDILCLYYSRTGHTKFAMEEMRTGRHAPPYPRDGAV